MSTMIGTMSLSGCGGVNKDAVAITMTSDDKDAIEVTMGYANFAARIQQAGYDSVFASIMEMYYWTNDSYAKDGKNMQESIKDSVLESIETQYLLEKHNVRLRCGDHRGRSGSHQKSGRAVYV